MDGCCMWHAFGSPEQHAHAQSLAPTCLQAEAAATSTQQRLSGLSKELESKAASDGDALRRLQESLASQQEELQRWVALPASS